MAEAGFQFAHNHNAVPLLRSGPTTFGTAGATISAKSGCLYQLSVINKNAVAYYFQVHDKATAPIAGNVPIWEQRLAASSDFTLGFQLAALFLANGFSVAISTTPALLTLAAADDCVMYARYTAAP